MFAKSRCHLVPLLPIVYAQSCALRGVLPVCPRRLSHDTRVCKVAHLTVSSCAKVARVKLPTCANASHVKVPSLANGASCAYVARCMVSQCAKLPISMCHRVPMLPTVCQERLLHDSPMYPCCPSILAIVCTSLVPILPISCAHRVQSFQCQCVPIVCQSFPSQRVPRVQKMPVSRWLCRPSCPYQCTFPVLNLPTAWCLC